VFWNQASKSTSSSVLPPAIKSLYPAVDTTTLEAIYALNLNKLEDTLRWLMELFPDADDSDAMYASVVPVDSDPLIPGTTRNAGCATTTTSSSSSSSSSAATAAVGAAGAAAASQLVDDLPSLISALLDRHTSITIPACHARYPSWRAEAADWAAQRDNKFVAAAVAHRSRRTEAASGLAVLGQDLNANMHRAHRYACLQLVLRHNGQPGHDIARTLDLHHLFVHEAIDVTRTVFETVTQRLAQSGDRAHSGRWVLSVITGAGVHSVDGKPRVRPALEKWLTQHGYAFTAVSAGELAVVLQRG
jgi:hypothetical protein